MKITFTNRDEILYLLCAMNIRIVNTETQIENLKDIGGKANLNHIPKLENKNILNNEIRNKLEKVFI